MDKAMTEQFKLQPGYLFATPPGSWWTRWICHILGAKTFHWGMLVAEIIDEPVRDWITSESISKGTTISRLAGRKASIYQIEKLPEIKPMDIIEIHSEYGDWPYDWAVGFWTGIWWLLKHYLGRVIRVIHDKSVNCQEWIVLLTYLLGQKHNVLIKIISDDEYPMSVNLENSLYLKYIGEVNCA